MVSKTLGIIPQSNLPINLCIASIGLPECKTPTQLLPANLKSIYNLKSGVSLTSSNIILSGLLKNKISCNSSLEVKFLLYCVISLGNIKSLGLSTVLTILPCFK